MKYAAGLVLTLAMVPGVVFANNNVGSCGWGSKLFKGQSGIFPQVLAVTTNGSFGNQTFAITSGTSGCTKDGVVTSSWASKAFIGSNINKLAMDASRGEGESIDSLASIMNVASEDKAHFSAALQSNFAQIFPNKDADTETVVAGLKSVLSQDTQLSQYAGNV